MMLSTRKVPPPQSSYIPQSSLSSPPSTEFAPPPIPFSAWEHEFAEFALGVCVCYFFRKNNPPPPPASNQPPREVHSH